MWTILCFAWVRFSQHIALTLGFYFFDVRVKIVWIINRMNLSNINLNLKISFNFGFLFSFVLSLAISPWCWFYVPQLLWIFLHLLQHCRFHPSFFVSFSSLCFFSHFLYEPRPRSHRWESSQEPPLASPGCFDPETRHWPRCSLPACYKTPTGGPLCFLKNPSPLLERTPRVFGPRHRSDVALY